MEGTSQLRVASNKQKIIAIKSFTSGSLTVLNVPLTHYHASMLISCDDLHTNLYVFMSMLQFIVCNTVHSKANVFFVDFIKPQSFTVKKFFLMADQWNIY